MIGTFGAAAMLCGAAAGGWLLRRQGAWFAVALVVFMHGVAWWHHVDDAGIDYAFARSVGSGLGLVAQPGGPIVEGVSNPLWLALLSFSEAMGVSAETASSAFQLLFSLACLPAASALAGRAGASASQGAAVQVAIAASGAVFAWTTAGLEGALFALALLCTAWLAACNRGVAVTVAVVVVAWVRPEGAAAGLVAAAAGSALIGRRGPLVWGAAGAVLGVLVLHGVRLWWLDTLWPNTVIAKVSAPIWRRVASGGVYALVASALTGLPFVGLGLWGSPRRTSVAALTVTAGALGLAVVSGGDWMRHGRFIAPYLPLLFALALPSALAQFERRLWVGRVAIWGVGLTGLVVLGDAVLRPTVPIDNGRVRGELYQAVLNDACGGGAVATPDVGGVLWFFPTLPLVDLAGLVDPEASHFVRDPDYWHRRFQADPPGLVDLHHGWAARTGLSDDRMSSLGYRLLGRRSTNIATPSEPSLWLHSRCSTPISRPTSSLIERWVVRGSGGG
ncbi:MAG: hypothetical protein AB8H79_02635 [Myxococcota bacterium]